MPELPEDQTTWASGPGFVTPIEHEAVFNHHTFTEPDRLTALFLPSQGAIDGWADEGYRRAIRKRRKAKSREAFHRYLVALVVVTLMLIAWVIWGADFTANLLARD